MGKALQSKCIELFIACDTAIDRADLMTKRSAGDKEYFFQDWFQRRLEEVTPNWEQAGRNAYPDFVITDYPEGFELKGLAYPGRKTFDSNSRYPQAKHRGRDIYYVFARYGEGESLSLPIVDLMIVHGLFLNAHQEDPKNKSFLGYGSYGDLQVRDRKMYTAPVPFWITTGTVMQRTLILPSDMSVDDRLEPVGKLIRREVSQIVVGYSFDFKTNTLTPLYEPNPNSGREYHFIAYRVRGKAGSPVEMVANPNQVLADELEEGE